MLDTLPDRLRRRTRLIGSGAPRSGPIVYWMRTAVRAHENAALDVAILLANHLGVPVFVYHALSERYPYASDRHHRFILEGARDVAGQLAVRGIATAFHLERPGHVGPHLLELAERASAVVTEEMPVAPLRHWTRRLADAVETPVLAVDTATVVPMRTIGKGVVRAYRYRERVQPRLDEELAPWVEVEPDRTEVPSLPFAPVDLERADLGELVAACRIDHSVPPVPGTTGGSTAGYARWNAFRAEGLARYAARRNDPLADGTSRLSPWLHYGMVAPTRIAREAREEGGKGPRKFVDELVVWRELAATWCLYAREHETLQALPRWARETLLAHASDPREFLPGSERLHLGETGVRLWDLAQQSLLRHGELHNNVRMTWGKALFAWTPDPATALRMLIDLNHRYALDGRDPASYGGLLWCLGLFDRPFGEQPVFGTVRTRPVANHARRLDLDAWSEQIRRPRPGAPRRVAVVGAGLAGAFAARILSAQGLEVVLFDKGRGAGGRTSGRRRDGGRFRHGAPVLHLHDGRLERWIDGWIEAGVIRDEGDHVRSSAPNDLVKHLQVPLDVRFGHRVTTLARDDGWTVSGETPDAPFSDRFDAVLLTAPTPQAVALLGEHPFTGPLSDVRYHPCWVGLFTYEHAQGPAAPGGPIERAIIEPDGRHVAMHATAAWSREHLELGRDEAAGHLAEAARTLGFAEPDAVDAHRWRYARIVEPLDTECLYDPTLRLAVAGDAFAGGDARGALLSGAAAAGRLLEPRCPKDA